MSIDEFSWNHLSSMCTVSSVEWCVCFSLTVHAYDKPNNLVERMNEWQKNWWIIYWVIDWIIDRCVHQTHHYLRTWNKWLNQGLHIIFLQIRCTLFICLAILSCILVAVCLLMVFLIKMNIHLICISCCPTLGTRGRSSLRSMERVVLSVLLARTSTRQARHTRWLALPRGIDLRWHSDCSPWFTLTHSTLASKLFSLAIQGSGALLSSSLEDALYKFP